ncbi:hypothetical protein [Halovenus salina]|uniref:hypothetical protein n=1 Tax=Halovenus salina TaxID=1510225 RepID=UPI002260A148|nr:hypothetical protein [Halovenus salina]
MPSTKPPASVTEYVEEGVRIAAILLVWGVLGTVATHGLADIGGPGSPLETLGPQLGALLLATGLLNGLLYVLYRTVDYCES